MKTKICLPKVKETADAILTFQLFIVNSKMNCSKDAKNELPLGQLPAEDQYTLSKVSVCKKGSDICIESVATNFI